MYRINLNSGSIQNANILELLGSQAQLTALICYILDFIFDSIVCPNKNRTLYRYNKSK